MKSKDTINWKTYRPSTIKAVAKKNNMEEVDVILAMMNCDEEIVSECDRIEKEEDEQEDVRPKLIKHPAMVRKE